MGKSFIIIILFLINNNLYSQKFNWEQPIQCGFRGYSIDKDNANLIYIAGSYMYFEGMNYLGNYELPLAINDSQNSFVAKTDSDFQIIWIKYLESSWCSMFPLVRVDHENNFFVTGLYRKDIKIDSMINIEKEDYYYCYLAKFSSNGKLLWYKTLHGNDEYANIQIKDLNFDNNNNIYIIGDYNSKIIFNNNEYCDTLICEGLTTSFMAKYSSEGKLEWTHSLHNSNQLNLNSLQIDKSNCIYVTGWCDGKFYFDSDTIDAYNSDMIIIKYDINRRVLWSKQIGTKMNTILEAGYSLAIDDKSDYLYVTGSVLETVDSKGNIVSANDRNIFLAKYSLDGKLNWVRNSGNWSGAASDVEGGKKVIVDKNNFIFISGEFRHDGYFGDTVIHAYNNPENSNLWNDIFVAKYFSNGDLSWATHAGHGESPEYLYDLMKDNYNNIFVGGEANNGAIFGDHLLSTNCVRPGFIGKIKDRIEDITTNINLNYEPIEIVCFPNPFADKINISFSSQYIGDLSVELYNSIGKLLKSEHFDLNNYELNVVFEPEEITAGFYFLNISVGNNKYNFKLVRK